MRKPPSDWYRTWSLDIKEQSWVEDTARQVDFIINTLGLTGSERILDLACGYGRHSLELARRGFRVTGVDLTRDYIEDAKRTAEAERLDTEFILADLRDVAFHEEYDVTLNLADGAIGYLEDDAENEKIFSVIADALKPGGRSIIDIINREHAEMHFPKKHWEIGAHEISLPCFDYDPAARRMLYGGFTIPFGVIAKPPESIEAHSSTRLYDFAEVAAVFSRYGVTALTGYGDYDKETPMDHRHIQMLVVSEKR